jgi:hypothetical protein
LNYLSIFLTIIFLLATPAFAQEKKKPAPKQQKPPVELIAVMDEHMPEVWKDFKSSDGGFSVLFPGTPKENTWVQSYEDKEFTTHGFQVTSPNAEYVVRYTDFPVRVDAPERTQAILDAVRTDTIEKDKGQLLKEAPESIAGKQGRYISWRTENGVIWQSKYFLTGYRIYVLAFAMPEQNNPPEEIRKFNDLIAAKFFDSFKLVATKGELRKSQSADIFFRPR